MSHTDSGIFEYTDGDSADEPDPDAAVSQEDRDDSDVDDQLSLADDDTEMISVTNHGGERFESWRIIVPENTRDVVDFELGDNLLITPTDNGGFRCEPIDE